MLGNAVLVASAGNCSENTDGESFHWPSELDNPRVIAVAALATGTNNLASFSSFGPASVDIAVPGTNHTLLNVGGGTNVGCDGTSFAAPMVTGTVGLLITNNVTGPIQGEPAVVVSRLLCNASVVAGLSGRWAAAGF